MTQTSAVRSVNSKEPSASYPTSPGVSFGFLVNVFYSVKIQGRLVNESRRLDAGLITFALGSTKSLKSNSKRLSVFSSRTVMSNSLGCGGFSGTTGHTASSITLLRVPLVFLESVASCRLRTSGTGGEDARPR